jgi:hypothetical protein
MLPRKPITMTAWSKLQLHQILQISLLIRLIGLLQLLFPSVDSDGSSDGGRHPVILSGELVTPKVFLGEPVSGPGVRESNLLWDLQVLADGRLCLAMLLVETGDLGGGGGGVSLVSRLASMHFKKRDRLSMSCGCM